MGIQGPSRVYQGLGFDIQVVKFYDLHAFDDQGTWIFGSCILMAFDHHESRRLSSNTEKTTNLLFLCTNFDQIPSLIN